MKNKLEIKYLKTDLLIPYVNNARTHSDAQVMQIAASIKEFGFNNPILLDGDKGIVAGHGRLISAKKLGLVEVPCIELSHLSEAQKKAYILADNKLAENAGWDDDLLKIELEELKELDFDLSLAGFDNELKGMFDNKDCQNAKPPIVLSEKFIIPPFSILDTRQGYWQDRKRYWKELICDNGESRIDTMGIANPLYKVKKGLKTGFDSVGQSVSLLDPVLAEISNKWFGIRGGKTFDCFAGDSVFGYVSDAMGNFFTGIELRQEQSDLNNDRLVSNRSKYICDDGQNILAHIDENSQDLLFSCPPYFDLEVYSDLKNDASNQKEYSLFLKILKNAFTDAVKCLKNNRFAVITVGDVRDKNGFYYRFVDDIKDIFRAAGVGLYNELILIEQIGTKAMTVNRSMNNRKVGKCHQNVLVFYKGDPKQISKNFPEILGEVIENE